MKLGVFTVLFSDLGFEPMLDRVAALGLDAVELGTGNYPGNAHCNPDVLLGDAVKQRALLGAGEIARAIDRPSPVRLGGHVTRLG